MLAELILAAVLAKSGDTAAVAIADGVATVDVRSKTGIGSMTLRRKGDQWPKRVVIRLNVTGLESLRLTAGEMAVGASVTSYGTHEQRFYKIVKDQEQSIKADDPLSPTIRFVDAKLAQFEITVPAELLKSNPERLEVAWIDFYR